MTQRFNPRGFSRVDILQKIDPANLIKLLRPYRGYLKTRGFHFPTRPEEEQIDYRQLAWVLLNSDEDTPAKLIEGLHVIGNMGIEERIDDLLEIAFINGVDSGDGGITPLDLAVRIWLKAPRALNKKEQGGFQRKLDFEHFPSRVPAGTLAVSELPSDLAPLEANLSQWFQINKRGPGVEIQQVASGTEARFLIDHGQPCKRERNRKGRESSWRYFRPERTDMVIYDAAANELRVPATTLGEMRLYVAAFGKYLFGDEHHFGFTQKYTLSPLQERGRDALACCGIEGLESIRLREVQWLWNGAFTHVETHRASDVFEAFAMRGMVLPKEPTIQKAVFELKLLGAPKRRLATIRMPNLASFSSGEEAAPVEQWLRQQGFILLGRKAEHEEADEVMADA